MAVGLRLDRHLGCVLCPAHAAGVAQMKKLITGSLAALALSLGMAAPANAYPWLSDNESQYLNVLAANNMGPRPWQSAAEIVAGGYWACDILGNHTGGYVASQVWLDSNSEPGGISYYQANTVVHAAIANLCPWRWY